MREWAIAANRSTILRGLAVALLVAVFVLPPAFLLLGAVHQAGLPPAAGYDWLPNPVVWTNFRTARDLVPLDASLTTSLLVVILAIPMSVLIASMAGFAIVTGAPRTRRALIAITAVALMVPPSALWVPRFAIFDRLELTGTIWPLVAPALMASTPLAVLVFALAYWRIPRHVVEAALVDGVRPVVLWWRVVVPLSRGATAAVALLTFLFHWSSYTEPLLYLTDPEHTTAAVTVASLAALDFAQLPIALAGAVIFTVPAFVVFLVAQRQLLGTRWATSGE